MRLPPEILEQIVQETASWRWTTAHIQLERRSREDLQALSLVSKAWRAPAQRLLFASRSFRLPGSFDAFAQKWGSLRCKSLRLDIDGYWYDQNKQQRKRQHEVTVHYQQYFSQRMQQIQCLDIFSEDGALYEDVALLLRAATRLRFFGYDHLYAGIADSSLRHKAFAELGGLRSMLSSQLQHLFLSKVLLQSKAMPLAELSLLSNLTNLVLKRCVVDDMELRDLINPTSKLRSIVLEDLAGPSVDAFSQALSSVGQQLLSLCLIFPRAGRQSEALAHGYVRSVQATMPSYRAAIPAIMRACMSLQRLQLRRSGVDAKDLAPLQSLLHLSVDVAGSLSNSPCPISVPGIREGKWLPQLQTLTLVPPDCKPFPETDQTYIGLNCRRRGITYIEDVSEIERSCESHFTDGLPDPKQVVSQGGY